jgi:hypothetical protein
MVAGATRASLLISASASNVAANATDIGRQRATATLRCSLFTAIAHVANLGNAARSCTLGRRVFRAFPQFERETVMRTALLVVAVVSFVVLAPNARAADQILRLSECASLTPEDLHALAAYALEKRRYTIEEDSPTLIVGEQDKLKVEIVIQPTTITVRWKEGFGHPKDQWLRNLKTDILWRLAE